MFTAALLPARSSADNIAPTYITHNEESNQASKMILAETTKNISLAKTQVGYGVHAAEQSKVSSDAGRFRAFAAIPPIHYSSQTSKSEGSGTVASYGVQDTKQSDVLNGGERARAFVAIPPIHYSSVSDGRAETVATKVELGQGIQEAKNSEVPSDGTRVRAFAAIPPIHYSSQFGTRSEAVVDKVQVGYSVEPSKVFNDVGRVKAFAAIPPIHYSSPSVVASETVPSKVQIGYGVQAEKQSEASADKARVRAFAAIPPINYSTGSAAGSGTVAPVVTDQIVAHINDINTEVEERSRVDVKKVEQSTSVKQEITTVNNSSTSASKTSANLQKHDMLSTLNGVGGDTSIRQDTSNSTVSNGVLSSAVATPTSIRFTIPPTPIRDRFAEIERLHREEKDRIVAMMTDEHEEFRHSYEEQLEAFHEENDRLLREIAAAKSQISVLEIQLRARGTGYDKKDVNITTITTTVTTITAAITIFTGRIEQWKQIISKGQLTISSKDLEQLSLDLSATSSHVTELLQQYAELSKYLGSVRQELRATSSRSEEKDRTITSLTAEVTQWKNADAAKTQQITVARQESETLRHDLSAASSQTAELQQRFDAQSKQLTTVRNEVRTKVSLIEENGRTISSLTTEVARWKQSDAAKADQLAVAGRDYEKLKAELSSASSSQIAQLQKRLDTQSKELVSVQTELQTNKSLVEEKERAITTLTAEVDQWKHADAVHANQSAAEHREKVKLQQDFAAFSARAADLHKQYDALSSEIVSIRSELHTKVSLLEEKERTISTLTTQVTQVKCEDSVKVEQIASARRDVEQLRVELSTASTRFAELQQRYDAQTKELTTVRDELHRIDILYRNGTGRLSNGSPRPGISQQISDMLEKKTKEMEELHRDLVAANARNAELQKSHELQSKEISAVRDEIKVKTSQSESIIVSLTAQVDQWKRADATKAERITIIVKQVEKLQQDLSVSSSQLTELQTRYEAQSHEFISVRNEVQIKSTCIEGKDRTIASLTIEIDRWKSSDATKADQIATTLKQLEKLQQDSSASATALAGLQSRYEVQSRELTSVRSELQTKSGIIVSLTADVDKLKRGDTTGAEQIASTVKQVEKLQQNLSVSARQLIELQGRYESQSRELVTVRNELQTRTTSYEEKSRTVISLAAQVEEWKRTDTLKEEQIVTIRKQVDELQKNLTISSSRITELQQCYDVQSKEVLILQSQLKVKVSEDKEASISSLRSDLEQSRHSDASKTIELTAAHKELEQIRRDLAATVSRLSDLQKRYDAQSTEFTSQLESYKRADTSKTEELTTARKNLEELRRTLATLSSQITDLQQRYEKRTTELTSQIESWKRSDATKTEELAAAHKDLEQLRRDVSAPSSQIIEYQQRIVAQSTQLTELTSQVEQWKHSDAAKTEELTTVHKKLEQLQIDLSASSSRIIEFQQRYEAQSTELISIREKLQTSLSLAGEKDRTVIRLNEQIKQWKRTDAAKAEELAHARSDIEVLRRHLSASTAEVDELEKYHAEQLDALRNSCVVSEKAKNIYESITAEVKDYESVIKLTSTVDEWLRADAKRAEELVFELDKRRKENEDLQRHLVTLKDIYIRAPAIKQIFQSETIQIERHYEQYSVGSKPVPAVSQPQMGNVQALVAAADTQGEKTIVETLQKLNAEVQQAASSLAEQMIGDFKPPTARLNLEQLSAVERVSDIVGQTLDSRLGSKERQDVARFLPIAFQAYMTYYLRSLIPTWASGTQGQSQHQAVQTTSGRQRSLSITLAPDAPISIVVSGLADVVVAASCAPSLSAAKAKVWSQLGDKLSSIISIAGQLSKTAGEVSPGKFGTIAVSPARPFEAATMEDVNDRGKGVGGVTTGQKVLCSTQLGLMKRNKAELGGEGALPLIKVKVVLESFVRA